jgi:hypothetical protein
MGWGKLLLLCWLLLCLSSICCCWWDYVPWPFEAAIACARRWGPWQGICRVLLLLLLLVCSW